MLNGRLKSFNIGHIAVWACALVALAGCQLGPPSSAAAERLAGEYYEALKAQDLEGAAMFFQDTEVQPRAQWLDQLNNQREKLGELQSYELADVTVNTIFSGVRYILRYKTKYTKHKATETLVMFEPVNEGPIMIQGLNIRSRGL